MNYCQCVLVNGNRTQVSWLPEKFAKVGKVLRLKHDGVWEEGWKVTHAGEPRPEEKVPDYRKYIKQHRKATGDAGDDCHQ